MHYMNKLCLALPCPESWIGIWLSAAEVAALEVRLRTRTNMWKAANLEQMTALGEFRRDAAVGALLTRRRMDKLSETEAEICIDRLWGGNSVTLCLFARISMFACYKVASVALSILPHWSVPMTPWTHKAFTTNTENQGWPLETYTEWEVFFNVLCIVLPPTPNLLPCHSHGRWLKMAWRLSLRRVPLVCLTVLQGVSRVPKCVFS